MANYETHHFTMTLGAGWTQVLSANQRRMAIVFSAATFFQADLHNAALPAATPGTTFIDSRFIPIMTYRNWGPMIRDSIWLLRTGGPLVVSITEIYSL